MTSQHVRPNAEVDVYTPSEGDILERERFFDMLAVDIYVEEVLTPANEQFNDAALHQSFCESICGMDLTPLHA